MSDEFDDELDEEVEDDHEWEYYEEAIQDDLRRESIERLHRMPIICQRCRWLEWYYFEECSRGLHPINGKCNMHCRDYGFVYHLPGSLRLLWWNIQYRIWAYWHRTY